MSETLQDLDGFVGMGKIGAPAATDLQVLFVDVEMGVQSDVAIVSVLTDDDIASGVPNQFAAFRYCPRVAAGFDHNVGTTSTGSVANGVGAFVRCGCKDVHRPVRAHSAGGCQPGFRSADN